MKYICIVLSLSTFFLWIDCKQTVSESIPTDAYAYTSYDSSGTALVRGWFTLIMADSATLSGKWHLEPIGDPQRIGPQTGDGNLVGGMNGEKVWIELNPKVSNNNLQLNGILASGRLTGQWNWIRYDGMANQGTFQAIKR